MQLFVEDSETSSGDHGTKSRIFKWPKNYFPNFTGDATQRTVYDEAQARSQDTQLRYTAYCLGWRVKNIFSFAKSHP